MRDPHAERARLGAASPPPRRCSSSGRASADSTKPGRPFFICTGVDPDVERAGGEARRGGVGHELGREVVEVGLDQRRRRARAPGSAARRPAPGRRSGSCLEVARAGAVAERARASSAASGRSSLGQRGHQRSAGGRDQLDVRGRRRTAARLAAARAWPARAAAAGRARPRRSRGRAGSGEQTTLVDAEALQRQRDAADVADRVDGADLVEVHPLGRGCRGCAPRPRPAAANARCARALARSGSPAASISSRIVGPVRGAAAPRRHHARRRVAPRSRAARPCPPRGRSPSTPSAACAAALDRRAGVEQRAEQHVARRRRRRSRRTSGSRRARRAAGDPRRDRAGAEAVVDVHHRDARRRRR